MTELQVCMEFMKDLFHPQAVFRDQLSLSNAAIKGCSINQAGRWLRSLVIVCVCLSSSFISLSTAFWLPFSPFHFSFSMSSFQIGMKMSASSRRCIVIRKLPLQVIRDAVAILVIKWSNLSRMCFLCLYAPNESIVTNSCNFLIYRCLEKRPLFMSSLVFLIRSLSFRNV